jgi:hypothetical protein
MFPNGSFWSDGAFRRLGAGAFLVSVTDTNEISCTDTVFWFSFNALLGCPGLDFGHFGRLLDRLWSRFGVWVLAHFLCQWQTRTKYLVSVTDTVSWFSFGGPLGCPGLDFGNFGCLLGRVWLHFCVQVLARFSCQWQKRTRCLVSVTDIVFWFRFGSTAADFGNYQLPTALVVSPRASSAADFGNYQLRPSSVADCRLLWSPWVPLSSPAGIRRDQRQAALKTRK